MTGRQVIVIGLGAMGSAAAQHLAERGYHVRGFDLFTPPHTRGSSHGLSRIFRQAYFEDPRYVPLLQRSFELWKKLERDTARSLLCLPGALVIGPRNGQLVARSAESAARFSLPHTILNAAELRQRFPMFAIEPETYAVLEQNAGYLRPEACIEAQLRQAVAAGARLHLNEAVLSWQAGSGGSFVTVRCASDTYTADHLVITAGPWAPQLLGGLGLPLDATRQVLFWFEPKVSWNCFDERHFPVYLIEEAGGRRLLYGFPLTGPQSEGIKVALHGSDDHCTPDSVCRDILASDERLIRERLEETVPGLSGRLIRAEVCLYTMTPDEHFVLGRHPYQPAVVLAAGFSGHGFKFAPVIGELVADLVSGDDTSTPDLFALSRFHNATMSQ